ncbi:MAG: tetratricopeptide repeat protein [Promethearchaeota archaeon]
MVKKSDLKKLNFIMQEGNEFKNLKEYNSAVEKYLEALRFVEDKVKEPEEREDETANIKSQIDQVYSVKIIDIIDEARNFIVNKDFDSAFNTFDEAARIADKIIDKDMNDYEVKEINFLINKTRIEESLFQAVLVKNKQELDKAISMLYDTLNAAKDFYMEDLEDQMIKKIEETINQTYSSKVSNLIENAKKFKDNDNLDETLEEFQHALELVDKYFDSDLKHTDKQNLINLTNQLYTEKINAIMEDGKKLFEESTFEDAAKKFEEAITISNKMYDTDYKRSEIKRINSMASVVLNPIYLEKIKPLFNEGKERIFNDNFEEDIVVVNEALDLFDKSLELANKMADSNEKIEVLSEITDSINNTCKIRIKFIKEKSIQKIGQRDYEKAINDLYAAISVAKRLPISDENNEDLEDLKNTVNKVYLAQIDEVVREGTDKLANKNYDEAIKIFNRALVMTNKMYLTQEMEEEINKIKGLVYQAELKDLVDRGDLSEELQKFEKELNKLNKKMDYAKTIDDATRRFQEMEQIKKSIDDVFYSKVKLLVEQGVQLAENENFSESFKNFESAININDSIKSPEFKNRIAIKYEYRLKLIDKAKLEIEKNSYDTAIQDCNKAIELDSTHIDAYYYIGIANNEKKEYNTAIDYFKKSIDLNPNHAKAWNHMGFSHEKLGQFEKAIDSYKIAVGFDSTYTLAHYNLANVKKQQK